MNIVVPTKLVPDLVEELAIDDSGTALDTRWLRLKLNEPDEHAIEQAILMKERSGDHVTVVSLDVEGAEDVLYTSAAKGADRLIQLQGGHRAEVTNHSLARVLANALKVLRPELILCGVQAHNDLDGAVGPRLAEQLGLPYVGYVSGVTVDGDRATVRKEYPGGLIAEMVVVLPAVLGIQAAEKPPRYVPVSKIRQTMKTAVIETVPASEPELLGPPMVERMSLPEVAERAHMIDGDPDEVAGRFVELFQKLGVL